MTPMFAYKLKRTKPYVNFPLVSAQRKNNFKPDSNFDVLLLRGPLPPLSNSIDLKHKKGALYNSTNE